MRSLHMTLRGVSRLAVVYALLGAVSMLLAIAPGFASPIFPAAGVALAGVLWMGRPGLVGVALGSLLFNLPHALVIGQPLATAVTVGTCTGLGAMLQAGAGAWLVRWAIGSAWRELAREHDALRFLASLGLDQRRLIGLAALAFGVALLWLARG